MKDNSRRTVLPPHITPNVATIPTRGGKPSNQILPANTGELKNVEQGSQKEEGKIVASRTLRRGSSHIVLLSTFLVRHSSVRSLPATRFVRNTSVRELVERRDRRLRDLATGFQQCDAAAIYFRIEAPTFVESNSAGNVFGQQDRAVHVDIVEQR